MGVCAEPTALAVGTSSTSGGIVSSLVQTYPSPGRLAAPPVALLHLALDEIPASPDGHAAHQQGGPWASWLIPDGCLPIGAPRPRLRDSVDC